MQNFQVFFFYNSSFLVSFPIDNYKNIFSNFNLVNDHVCKNTSLSRFSIFPIAIFFNGISIPIEYAHFFFYNAEKLEIFSDNVKFSSFIIMNSYSRQILIFNKFFFNNGNY